MLKTAYEMNLCAFRVGEHMDIRLPVMVHQDGFITSHTAQNVCPLSDEEAYKFVGVYNPVEEMLDFSRPVTYGAQTEEDWHYEHKARQHKALMDARPVIESVFAEFEKVSGRAYKRVESYMTEDAEVIIVALGTTVESARVAAKQLRDEEGIKAGVVAPRVIRPFPFDAIRDELQNCKAIGAMDRSSPGGALGMLFNEVSAAMYTTSARPVMSNYIYGLGGRDLSINAIKDIYRELQANATAGEITTPVQQFISLRGPKLSFFETRRS